MVALVGVVVIAGVGIGLGVGTGGSSSKSSKPGATPAAGDVAAASACAAFVKFLDSASGGSVPQNVFQPFVNDANALVQGAKPGEPQPKWFPLGSALLGVGNDVVKDNPQQLQTDATTATHLCSTVPPAADRAAGYTPPGQ